MVELGCRAVAVREGGELEVYPLVGRFVCWPVDMLVGAVVKVMSLKYIRWFGRFVFWPVGFLGGGFVGWGVTVGSLSYVFLVG